MLRLLFVAILLTSCSQPQPKPETTTESIEQRSQQLIETIGYDAYDLIANPERVEGFALKGEPSPKNLSLDQIKQLQELLLNDSSYQFEFRKKIVFLPTYGLKFIRGMQSITIEVSVPSSQVKFNIDAESMILDNDPAKDKFESFINTINK